MFLAIVVKNNLSPLWVTVCRTARGPGADFSVVSRHSTDVVQQVPVTNVQDHIQKDCKDERLKTRKSS
jgi:hypothetical protein